MINQVQKWFDAALNGRDTPALPLIEMNETFMLVKPFLAGYVSELSHCAAHRPFYPHGRGAGLFYSEGAVGSYLLFWHRLCCPVAMCAELAAIHLLPSAYSNDHAGIANVHDFVVH